MGQPGQRGKGPKSGKKQAEVQDVPETPGQTGGVGPQSLMKKAYEIVNHKLNDNSLSSKAIDDLVKLLKLEKDLGDEGEEIKEVKVRWQPSEDESSSEE